MQRTCWTTSEMATISSKANNIYVDAFPPVNVSDTNIALTINNTNGIYILQPTLP